MLVITYQPMDPVLQVFLEHLGKEAEPWQRGRGEGELGNEPGGPLLPRPGVGWPWSPGTDPNRRGRANRQQR